MQSINSRKRRHNVVIIVIIVILCVITIVLDFLSITYVSDEFRNRMISKILQQSFGIAAMVLLMIKTDIRLFGKPKKWLYLIPCVIIAVDNFPFWSYFSGNMYLVRSETLDFLLFGIYCLSVGIFEECIFRGIIFSVLASRLSQDKKGFVQTYIISSAIFGVAHLFNGISLGTLLQVGYTILTGGLFAFTLIKTKNILCCGVIHAIYNFCGLLLSEQGMGSGIVFDVGTTVTMAIISIVIGVFVLYKVFTYSDAERAELYTQLGIKTKNKDE